MQATLAKWGNSQGIRIPVEVCETLGIAAGARAEMRVNPVASTITLHFERSAQHYARHRKMALEEFAGDWAGGRVGQEWGGPDIGAEVVE